MIGKAGFQFLQVVVLARLLAPQDFGLMALVMAVIAFAQIFADMGVSNAIIHHQQISHEQLSSLYWLNVLAGTVLSLVLVLVSPLVASFYREPRLQPVLVVISSYFVITAFGQQLRVVAEKNLRFSVLAKVELAAAFTGFVAAVIVALMGGGVYALIAGLLSSAVMLTIFAWVFLALGWRPLLRLRLGEIQQFLGFGAYIIGNNVINTFNSTADLLLGGRMLGASSLGVYSLPRELSLRVAGVINPIVTRVGLPVMAKVQGDKALLKSVYLKTLRMTASVNFPLYLALALFAPEAVTLFFGSQWQASVPLLRILSIWGMFRSLGNPVGSLIFATGRADLAFKWNLALFFVISPMVWVGLHFGNAGLAWSLLTLSVFVLIPNWFFLVRPLCGAGFIEYFRQLAIPLFVAGVAATAASGAASLIIGEYWHLIAGLSVGTIAYAACSSLLNREWFCAIRELVRPPIAKS